MSLSHWKISTSHVLLFWDGGGTQLDREMAHRVRMLMVNYSLKMVQILPFLKESVCLCHKLPSTLHLFPLLLCFLMLCEGSLIKSVLEHFPERLCFAEAL